MNYLGSEERKLKKQKAVEYYATVPVYKYTAMSIGIDMDTLKAWRDADLEFSEALLEARAKFVSKNVKGAKQEFKLERLEKEVFAERRELEHSGGVNLNVVSNIPEGNSENDNASLTVLIRTSTKYTKIIIDSR